AVAGVAAPLASSREGGLDGAGWRVDPSAAQAAAGQLDGAPAATAGGGPPRDGPGAAPWVPAWRRCSWCLGRLGPHESLALATGGLPAENCELCYLLTLATHHAFRARLTPGERAAVTGRARELTALVAALAWLADSQRGPGGQAEGQGYSQGYGQEFPGSLRRYVRRFLDLKSCELSATKSGWLRRDVSPLSYPVLGVDEVILSDESIGDRGWEGPLSRLEVAILGLHWGAGYRSLKFAWCCLGRASAAQAAAIWALARIIYRAMLSEVGPPPEVHWSERLKDRGIAYDGSEVSMPLRLMLERVLDGLPPPGSCASASSASGAASGGHLGAYLVFDGGVAPHRGCAPIEQSEIAERAGRATPPGPEQPRASQLGGLVPAETEDLLWSGADQKPGASTRVCLKVIGMGWVSAAGVATHLRRDMLSRGREVPRGLRPSDEITRRRRLPLGVAPPCPAAWLAHVNNLQIAEVVGKNEAVELKGGYLAEMASLAFWVLGRRRASRRPMQILLGRWVRAHCFRCPPASSSARAWRWLAGARAGGRVGLGVAEALLLSSALSALPVASLRLKAAPVALIDGIGGGRRALEIPGLAPAIHLAFEICAAAVVRAARRACPSTAHLGDVSAADPRDLAKRPRGRVRISRVLVMGGLQCQARAALDVDRQGLADPRAGLVQRPRR
ncbi:unnamed protein product, partial [Prorocentrum cordatum]